MSAARQYRLLGGLEVTDGGEQLDLGTRQQRAVLAALALAGGWRVSVDRLDCAVWEEDPPDRVEASLPSYISTLRRTLEPGRKPREKPRALATRGGGYALLVERDQVDVTRFEDLLGQGRQRRAEGDLEGAAAKLRNALAMWAPLLPGFDGAAFIREPAVRLSSLHEVALELSYDVRLELGEHQMLLPELESAAARYPLNEARWAQLALARYRSGRQSDALRALADCRHHLNQEIGVDPGPALRQLDADVLAHAPHLEQSHSSSGPTRVSTGSSSGPVPGGGPVAEPSPLVGRTTELSALHDELAEARSGRARVVMIEGEPGVGKTTVPGAFATSAAAAGANVTWGRCVTGAGRRRCGRGSRSPSRSWPISPSPNVNAGRRPRPAARSSATPAPRRPPTASPPTTASASTTVSRACSMAPCSWCWRWATPRPGPSPRSACCSPTSAACPVVGGWWSKGSASPTWSRLIERTSGKHPTAAPRPRCWPGRRATPSSCASWRCCSTTPATSTPARVRCP